MAVMGKKPVAAVKGKKKTQTFVIDCTKPVDDKIMDIASFEKYLIDRIKVNGKTGAPASSFCSSRGLCRWLLQCSGDPRQALACRAVRQWCIKGRECSWGNAVGLLALRNTCVLRARRGERLIGAAGSLGDLVKVQTEKAKVTVTTDTPFSKRCAQRLCHPFIPPPQNQRQCS